MKLKPFLFTAVILVVLQACSSSSNSPRAVPAPPTENPNGEPATGVMTAIYAPADGVTPIPANLLFSGTTDLTLNTPTADPTDFSDPLVALSALDGFSTTAPWVTNFSSAIAPATVNPSSVKVYQVELTGPGGATTSAVRELTFGVDFVAAANGAALTIVPLKPLDQLTSYMAIVTNGITDAAGNSATPDQTYFISQRRSPLVDANGNSTDPLVPNSTAQALEPLRQLTNAREAVAASQGVNVSDIVLSWTVTTQSITPVLATVKSISRAGESTLAPTGLTTAAVPGGAGLADIYIGTMSSPYYLTAPSAENPTAPLNGFWKAAPGAYVPPFDGFGLDPTSTNLTFANPIPVATSTQNLPVLMTVPNASSGAVKPASGWPILIFQHGITRNRTDILALADTMASIGFAVVGIDLPLHGVTDPANPFYIGNTPFAAISSERTFDLDFTAADGTPGPDGVIDSSGSLYINLSNLLVSRDNVRQGSADLFTLTETIPVMDIDGDTIGDFDASRIAFSGLSLGSITGINFLAMDPNITSALVSAPGGGIAQLLIGSPTFGPRILAGLAANGVEPGTDDFNLFVLATQTVIDSADPINFGALATQTNNIILHEIIGDQVITNTVPNAPLSGTEPLIAVMGLQSLSATTVDAAGLDGAVRFIEGDHGSILSPAASLAATIEMQSQVASFHASAGTALVITNTDVVQQGQ
ncbi:Ig-like domain-containing protein [Marinicella sp. W31]|uniref:Ig-like domain-containing protein n=1 Tax=Marinicella sp. W31 TaxID=3023713 RepID=UPI0037575EA8